MHSMLRSVLSNWAGYAISGIVSFVLTPILLHGLGPVYFGLWMLSASVLDYYGLLDTGMRTALFRFIARYRGANERTGLDQTLSTILVFTVGLGVALALLLPVVVTVLPRLFSLDPAQAGTFRSVLVLVGFSLIVSVPARVLGSYLSGMGRFDLYNLTAILSSIFRAIFFSAVLWRGYGVVAVAAVTLAGSVFALALNWWLVRWSDPEVSIHWRHARYQTAKELGSYGLFAFINVSGDYLRSYMDAIVIARMLGVALVAPFSVASRLMEYFKLLIVSIGGPLLGVMSALDGQQRSDDLRDLVFRSTRLVAVASLWIGSMLLIDGKALIHFWVGDRYASSYGLAVILAAGYVVSHTFLPLELAVFAKARHRPLAWVTLAEGAANLALSIYLARPYGLLGVAMGTAIPLLCSKLVVQPFFVFRIAEVPWGDYLRKALVRPLLVAGAFIALFRSLPAVSPASLGGYALLMLLHAVLFLAASYWGALTAVDRRFVMERVQAARQSRWKTQPAVV